jgi:hypothetical protein
MRHFLFLSATVLFCLTACRVEAQVYGDTTSLVDSWYRTYLGRAPDPAMSGWVAQLNQGVPADRVLASILGSDEYYLRAGSTPQGFITRLYSDVLQRAPTPAELDYWVRRMYTTDRTAIADAVLTQNPGVWVSTPTPAPPAVATSPAVVPGRPSSHWDRDRHWDWDRYHDIHEYHRPGYAQWHEHPEHHR